MRRNLVFDLIKLSIFDNADVDLESIKNMDDKSWEWSYDVLAKHGVAALVCNWLGRNAYGITPPPDVLINFVSAETIAKRSYVKLKKIMEKLTLIMSENGIKSLLLKGFSLAAYYPQPELRIFADIDIYAPNDDRKIDGIFASRGVPVKTHFYRHSHMKLGSIAVENHHYLLDVRGRKRFIKLDADLRNSALIYLDSFDAPGLYYPDPYFSLIFNLHHAMSHFIYEGISLKFLVDWIYFFQKEIAFLDSDKIGDSLREHQLLKFAAVMTEVSVRYLGLNYEIVPEYLKHEMSLLPPFVIRKFLDDLFRPYHLIRKRNFLTDRLNSVLGIIRASWKPKIFLDQSAVVFIWNKFLAIMVGESVEAD